jgi:putative sigma-54 modulation protein
MQIDIHTHGISLTDALRVYTARRLRFALAGASERVRRIKVRFSDVNGPRGGFDKRCRIHATFNGIGEVMIEDTDTDAFRAIGSAAARFGRSVSRRLRLRHSRDRSIPRRLRRVDASLIEHV